LPDNHKNDFMKKKFFIVFFFGFLTLTFSCRKDPDFNQLSTNFTVITNLDSSANFRDFHTYYISDTIAWVGGKDDDSILYDDNSKLLVQTVKDNMNARGYTFVSKNSNPDLGFNMGAVKTTTVSIVYPGWWWGYPGWWDPWYWGWYYPYYYPWSVAYAVTTGSVIVDMVDLKDAQSHRVETIIWSAVANGALGSSTSTNVQRGVDAINQAFKQTPEISAN